MVVKVAGGCEHVESELEELAPLGMSGKVVKRIPAETNRNKVREQSCRLNPK